MSLSASMYTARTGLMGHQQRLDILGNDLANVNTAGYKKTQHNFGDFMSQALRGATGSGDSGSTNPIAIGQGVGISSADHVFTQGGFDMTGRTTDLALEGNGFFILERGADDTEAYTRDGSFYFGEPTGAATGQQLFGNDGLAVQGYTATNGIVNATGDPDDIIVPFGSTMPAVATANVTLSGNLDSRGTVNEVNSIATGGATGWITDNSSTINVGNVLTSYSLFEGGIAATASTDLASLQYQDSSGAYQTMFLGIAAGDEVDISFDRGGISHDEAFTYGTDGTTLADFASYMTGDLGDDGAVGTERLNGGALGTIRTMDSANPPAAAEHAGAYLRSQGGLTNLSIASNVGYSNAITDLELTFKGAKVQDMFAKDSVYGDIATGGYSSGRISVFEDTGAGVVVEKDLDLQFSLVSRDQNGSTWRWMADGDDTSATPNRISGTGLAYFDAQGLPILDVQDTPGAIAFTIDPTSFTQLSSATDIVLDEQDGYAQGTLMDISITPDGVINGSYDNGVVDAVAQVALADFINPHGLSGMGGNLFAMGPASGLPVYGGANTLGFGQIRSGMLESSNVEVSEAMTNIITTQRGYQVNAKVISTSDELLQSLLQMKR